MRKLIQFIWLLGGAPAGLAIAAAMLVCCQPAQAQFTNQITNATLSTLQNALVSGASTIQLQFNDTITTTTPLEIVEDTIIDGTGFTPILSGGGSSQIFFVDPGVNFTLINVTLSGGKNTGPVGTTGANGGNGGTTGGGGSPGGKGTDGLGGAVYNQGNSAFIGCLFFTNAVVGGAGGPGGIGGNGNSTGGNGGAGGAGGVGYGGAIYNLGTILLSNCTVAGNTTTGGLGGAGGTNGTGPFASYPGAGGAGGASGGAGIYNLGKATIVNCTLNQNSGISGAANLSPGGAPGSGGNGAAGAAGAASLGGGIANFGTNSFVNCTVFANSVTGGAGGDGGVGINLGKGGNGGNGGSAIGGGVYNGTAGLVAITNCTFSGDVVIGGTNGVAGFGNFAGQNGSPGAASGANIANVNTGATFLLKNTILDFPTNATSASGTITDQGNNLSSDATPVFSTTNSFNSKDPKLSPTGLTGNGSSTIFTIALSGNSPAINAIYDGSAPTYDERGFVRPGQVRPDIGAYEFGSFFTNYNVTGTVFLGNTNTPFPGVLVSAGSLSTTVTGTNGVFQFSLFSSNAISIHPNPPAFFSPPTGIPVVVTNPVSGLVFFATNAAATFTNVSGTNTNTFSVSFAGIANFATYHIQAATNLSTNASSTNVVWTTIATNLGLTNGGQFSFLIRATNGTNVPERFFRAVSGPQ